jgi:hypothetical protein
VTPRRLLEERGGDAERVEELPVGLAVGEELVLVLARDVDEARDDAREELHGADRAVRVDPPPPRGARDAPDEELPPVGREPGALEPAPRLGPVRDVEERLDRGLLRAAPDELDGHPPAPDEPRGADDDRLAGAGLAREDAQPGPELEVDLLDGRDVLDAQLGQHARSSLERAPRPARAPIGLDDA